ncbi:MAG: hypothetical protein WCT10_01105 [Patescibacteria group bacterium]|jgi:hypothetical protein
MALGSKESKQIKFLAGFVVVCVLVAVFIFRDRFVPSPSAGGKLLPAVVRFTLPSGEAQRLFGRQDYKELKAFGEIPIVVTESGSSKFFD